MACPYFAPESRLESGPWTHEPRWPLGAAYAGVCHALSGEIFRPPESQQQEYCNCGYARGVCERFPLDAPADAVRFSVTGEQTLFYILERDHAPVEFGRWDISGMKPGDVHRNPILMMQAEAFLAAYRMRTSPR